MILILSAQDDQHADHVEAELLQRDVAFLRFDPATFPRETKITVSHSCAGRSRYMLQTGEDCVDLRRLRAVWYRRPGRPVAHASITEGEGRQFVEQECSTLVQDLWSALDCFWLPAAPSAVRQAGLKALQLKVAGELGFDLPPTLITNNVAELLEFYRQHNGHIVSKLVGNAFLGTVGNRFVRYTEMVTTRTIAHAHAIEYCPMIFQAYVPKRIELRITVVGRRVFAAEIHSQTSNHTRVDWRRYDNFGTPHFPHVLPNDIAQRCLGLVSRLGLYYGAIDMIVTPFGQYVFLEINPNGQYLWIEQVTGLPITSALCDVLMGDQAALKASESVGHSIARGVL